MLGRVVVANALSSDKSISRRTAVLSQVQLRNSPISHGQLLYEIGLHCKVKITNGVFFAPEDKFAAIYFSLFTKYGFRVV